MNTETAKKDFRFSGQPRHKHSLVTIQEYAAREGVRVEMLEACGKAGIVQIRRHKGRSYVVDQPLTPYSPSAEQKKAAPKQDIQAGSISSLAERMLRQSGLVTRGS